MSLESEWKGRIDERINTHGEYHVSHFKSIEQMKLDIKGMNVKLVFFSTLGSLIGSGIVMLLVSILVKKL